MPNHRSIYLTATALTITQIVDGIKYVGFTHPIIADKAIHLRRKRQRGFRNIFIIEYGNALKYHQGQKYKIFSTTTRLIHSRIHQINLIPPKYFGSTSQRVNEPIALTQIPEFILNCESHE